MTTLATVIIRHVLAALKWPSAIETKLQKAKTIFGKLTGNAKFPLSSWPANIISLAQLGTDIDAFDAAQTAVKKKTGTVADRNTKMNTVHADLVDILTMVQKTANLDPANAEDIIKGAGYECKIITIKQKQQNGAHPSGIAGIMVLTAEGGGAHQWQITKDKTNITVLDPTTTAHTLTSSLNIGDVMYQRSRPILKKGQTADWSAWIEFKVQ